MSKTEIKTKKHGSIERGNQEAAHAVFPKVEPAYATAVEAAAFMRISRGMVIKMAKEGELPFRRFGRNFRIPWDWLRKNVPQ